MQFDLSPLAALEELFCAKNCAGDGKAFAGALAGLRAVAPSRMARLYREARPRVAAPRSCGKCQLTVAPRRCCCGAGWSGWSSAAGRLEREPGNEFARSGASIPPFGEIDCTGRADRRRRPRGAEVIGLLPTN